jgi:hypothetical protein
MFWDWFFFISYSAATVCAIANMSKGKDIWGKIFRMAMATVMFVMSILYGNMMLVAMLEGIA